MNTPTAPSSSVAPLSDGAPQLLIVDTNGLTDRVAAALPDARHHTVHTWLAAMGELTRRRVDAVIGPLDAMSDLIEPTARGVRELAPDALLLLVAGTTDRPEARAALDAGFDRCIEDPADHQCLAQVVRDHLASNGRCEPARPSHGGAKPFDPPARDADLGDTDLAEAVMAGMDTLRDVAMRIVRARGDLPGAALSAPRQTVPESDAQAPVQRQGLKLGTLHAPPPASRDRLRLWADWLAHWLALGRQHEQLKHLAMHDELTGAWNRRYFNRFLARVIDRAARDRSQVTLMVFDIDDFKHYNDVYGHAAGDEILRESVRLMQAVVREHDVVARIGGDEFAVIFWDAEGPRKPNSTHPHDVAKAARRFQQAICSHNFPKLLDEAPGTLTISAGLASYPWDGSTPDQLLARADEMALRSKRQGKNAITFGPGALPEPTPPCDES